MTSGIYKLYFEQNPNHFYIGSSNNIENRWREHKRQLKNNTHDNSILLRAVNKYEYCNLKTEIIEECAKDFLFIREQYYIDNLKPAYNIRSQAQGGRAKEFYVFCNNNYYSLIHGIKHQKLEVEFSKLIIYSKYYATTPEGYYYRRLTSEELNLGYYFANKTGFMYITTYDTNQKINAGSRKKVPLVLFRFMQNNRVIKSSYDLKEVVTYRNSVLDINSLPTQNKIIRKLNEEILMRYSEF